MLPYFLSLYVLKASLQILARPSQTHEREFDEGLNLNLIFEMIALENSSPLWKLHVTRYFFCLLIY